MANRAHPKLLRLPPAIVTAVNNLIVGGKTIEQVTDHLKALGHGGEIKPDEVPSRSAVGRYAKGFLARLERLKIIREQCKAITETSDGGLDLEQAGIELALEKIVALLLATEGEMSPKVLTGLSHCLADIQRASSTRERAKIDIRKDMARRAVVAAKEVGKMAKSQGLSANAVDEIKKKILGISDANFWE